MKTKATNLALTLATLIITAFICEGVLRLFYILPQPLANYYPLEAAKLGQTIYIQQFEFSTEHKYNKQGFRDKEIKFKKENNKQRVVFVGDSFAEGFGVSESNRFSNVVADGLGKNFEIINIGQLATNPDSYFNNLMQFGFALRPDFVIMSIYMGNDFQGGSNLPPPSTEKLKLTIESQSNSYLKFSYLEALIKQVYFKKNILVKNIDLRNKNYWELYFNRKIDRQYFEQNNNLSPVELDRIVSGFNPKIVSEAFAGRIHPGMFSEAIKNQLKTGAIAPPYTVSDFEKTYEYIKAAYLISKTNNIKFILLIIPDINQIHPREYKAVFERDFLVKNIPSRFAQLKELQKKLIIKTKQDGIPVIDPTDELKTAGRLTYYLYDNHMNNLGHKIVGNLLINYLGK